jgi:putative PIN family toxin of toxin-antitoxin system
LKVIFDTNVLISAFLTEGLCWKLLTKANRKEFDLFISSYILEEFEDNLCFKLNLPLNSIKEALSLIKEISTLINPEDMGIVVKGICQDPSDDPILASAVAAEAHYLVTGDADLLSLGSYKKIKIINPRTFDGLFTTKSTKRTKK